MHKFTTYGKGVTGQEPEPLPAEEAAEHTVFGPAVTEAAAETEAKPKAAKPKAPK
jgi:hypothetical protein